MKVKNDLRTRNNAMSALTVVFAVISLVYVFPVLMVLLNSFKGNTFVKTETFAFWSQENFVGFDNFVNLLGGGGLVRAYSHSAKIGVDSAKIITMAHCIDLAVECDYTFYGKLTDFLSREDTVILDTEYTDNVKVTFRIKSENKDNINAKLTELSYGKVFSTVVSEEFCEF